jgi:HEAT repeat protein
VERWIAQLQDPNIAARREAVQTICSSSPTDDRLVLPLAEVVADADLDVSLPAVIALGKLGPSARSAAPALETALQDSRSEVAFAAALALQKIAPDSESYRLPLIVAMRRGDGRTLLAVGDMGAEAAWAVPTLAQLLGHEKAKLRALAAVTLGRLGHAAATAEPALRRAVHDSDPAVRDAATTALDQLHGKTPIKSSPEPASDAESSFAP